MSEAMTPDSEDTIRERIQPEPKVIGRFNYTSYKENLYNIVFTPFREATCMIIVRNLPRGEAIALKQELNAQLDITYRTINNIPEPEDEGDYEELESKQKLNNDLDSSTTPE